jgi:2-methylcitrate dehydratase PrpD
MAAHGATAELAAFACSSAPAEQRHPDLARVLLDTVGCAVAGKGSPPEALLRRWCMRERTTGRSTVWTTGEQVSASQAALLNGTAGHALDWDDVSPGSVLHPSTVLLPALVAQAEELGEGGPALAEAYDVGAAVFRAVTQALPRLEHYRRGWHTTSTVGRLAAVAALANLRGLDEGSTRNALGLAGSLAAGSLANFGTMTKPLHAGVAARDAVMAVGLAADGFTANSGQLEAAGGFFALYGAPTTDTLSRLAADLRHWRTEWPADLALKRYPACYATHRAVDAALSLRAALAGRTPERIEVVVEPGGLRPLLARHPATATEAKFSMAYAVSVALVHGEFRLKHFDAAALDDERVRSSMAKVTARESEIPPLGDPAYGDGYAVLTLALPGSDVSDRVDHTYGDSCNPLSDADLDAKFADCCEAAGLHPAATRRLARTLRSLPQAPSFDLFRETLGRAAFSSRSTE